METFNAAYFINLESRKDRRFFFEKNAKYLNIENINRIKAVEISEINVRDWPGSKSELAIRESHIYTLEEAKRKNYEKFIVFEDDAIVPKNFSQKISTLMSHVPENWDMIYLYAENHYLKPKILENGILRLQNTLGMVSIIYNRKNLDRIIFKLKNDLRWVDSVMADLHTELNVYAPNKSIIRHSFGFSDNLGKFVDYKSRPILNYIARLLNFVKKIF